VSLGLALHGFKRPEKDLQMSSDIAIKVDNLSKCYQLYDKPRDRLLQMLMRGHRRYYREFWALKDISFEIKKGETVGIIGRNGSGKSTLLQIICGTLAASSGTVKTRGRIAALLELGSGFNQDFTGRENVYMNGSILGLSKDEMDACYEDIIAFADIGDFIEQQVRTYSSGMIVRLAFAVQAMVSPDILVVDEALAVGDAKFQAKCFDRLKQLKERGTSILLVTHAGEQVVTHCSQAILLDEGIVSEKGEPRRVVNRYMDVLFGKERIEIGTTKESLVQKKASSTVTLDYSLNNLQDVFSSRPGYNPHEYRWGDGSATIYDFYLAVDNEEYPSAISVGQRIVLVVSIRFLTDLVRPILGITIKTKEGVTVYGVNSETLKVDEFKLCGQQGTVVKAEAVFYCRLAPGDYFISLGVATRSGGDIIPHDRRYDAIHLQVCPDSTFFGLADLGLSLSAQVLSI
jgi:lipopolysaccharide transport system ATP-binding protein